MSGGLKTTWGLVLFHYVDSFWGLNSGYLGLVASPLVL